MKREDVKREGGACAKRVKPTAYIPFGPAWQKEAMRNPKDRLVSFLRDAYMELRRRRESGGGDERSTLNIEHPTSNIKDVELVSIIRWTRVADGLPAYGQTVAIWMPALGLVVRAFRDGTATDGDNFRVAGVDGPRVAKELVAAWAELPNGPLPPPDGGAA